MKFKEILGKTVSMRSAPVVTAAKIGSIAPYATVAALQVVDDLDHPGNAQYKWIQLAGGMYANYIYPPNGLRFQWLDAPHTSPSFSIDLYRVKWDFQVYTSGFAARPAAFQRLQPFDHTLMDAEIQRLWFHQIELEGHGLSQEVLLQVWRWLTASNRFITNGQGPDIRRDYILNQRMDQQLPGIFSLASSGNVLKGRPEFDKVWWLVVDTLTPNMSFPSDLCYIKYPWWIHYGTTTTTKKLADKTYLCNPFTTNIWQGRNAPYPLFASQEVRIEMRYLDKLPAGTPLPSPYNPPRNVGVS